MNLLSTFKTGPTLYKDQNLSFIVMSFTNVSNMSFLIHPAGTSTDSDKCDLSKDSDMAPLTLGSMENTTYFISHRKPN